LLFSNTLFLAAQEKVAIAVEARVRTG